MLNKNCSCCSSNSMTFNQIHSNTSTIVYLHFWNKISTMRIQMHSNRQFANIQDMTSQASECRSSRGVEVDQGIRTIWIRKMSMNPIVRICLGGLRVHSRDDSLHLICRSSRIVAMAYQMQALEIRRKIKLKKKLLQALLNCEYAQLRVARDAIVRQQFNLHNATCSEHHS